MSSIVGGTLKPLTLDSVQFWVDRREKLESGDGEITEDEWIHERKKWTGLARKRCHPGEQQPCAACNQYRGITHAHHLAPLGMQFDRGFVVPVQQVAWLCPNHHVLVHVTLEAIREGDAEMTFLNESGIEEIEMILELAHTGLHLLRNAQ